MFVDWQSSGESAVLWINAPPGSGKSVLSASIIDRLTHLDNKRSANVIYFFCRCDDPEKGKAISALRWLALQALKLIQYIPVELDQLYQDEYSPAECFIEDILIVERVLGYLLKRIAYVYIIVDGLDECGEGPLLEALIRLRNQKGYGITKWLFTSCNDPIARKVFEASKTSILTVPKTIMQNDIRRFLEDNADVLCVTDDQLERITKISQGNFLAMRLTVNPFCNEEVTCSEEFEEALDNFHPELGQCWFRRLQKLSQRPEKIQNLAQ